MITDSVAPESIKNATTCPEICSTNLGMVLYALWHNLAYSLSFWPFSFCVASMCAIACFTKVCVLVVSHSWCVGWSGWSFPFPDSATSQSACFPFFLGQALAQRYLAPQMKQPSVCLLTPLPHPLPPCPRHLPLPLAWLSKAWISASGGCCWRRFGGAESRSGHVYFRHWDTSVSSVPALVFLSLRFASS